MFCYREHAQMIGLNDNKQDSNSIDVVFINCVIILLLLCEIQTLQ